MIMRFPSLLLLLLALFTFPTATTSRRPLRIKSRRPPSRRSQPKQQPKPSSNFVSALTPNTTISYVGTLSDASTGSAIAKVVGNVTTFSSARGPAVRRGSFAYLGLDGEVMTAYKPTKTSKPRPVPGAVEYGRAVGFAGGGRWLNSTSLETGGSVYARIERLSPGKFNLDWSAKPPTKPVEGKRRLVSFGRFGAGSKMKARESYDFAGDKVTYKRHGECPEWYSVGRWCCLEMEGVVGAAVARSVKASKAKAPIKEGVGGKVVVQAEKLGRALLGMLRISV